MSLHALAPRPLATDRSPWLRGVMQMPGDRLASHLALILGGMARGETIVDGLGESADVFTTGRAMQALGARIEKRAGRWHIMGIGVGGFLEPEDDLHFGNSTLGLQLSMGLLGPYDFTTRFVGDPALAARSQDALLKGLGSFGVGLAAGDDRLPFALKGPRQPVPADYRMELPLAAVKAAMLLGALTIPGTTTVREPTPSRDQAEKMLRAFGARVDVRTENGGRVIEIDGLPNLRAQQVLIAGDPSLAAHALVAGLIVPNSEILIEGVLVNPTRIGLFQTLREMGGNIEIVQARKSGGEDVADIRVIHSPLHGITVPPERMPLLVEEFPLLAVAAAFADGDTELAGLGILRQADCDQVRAVARGLDDNRVAAATDGDGLVIHGAAGRVPGRGRVATEGDAAIAMAFLVMGMAAEDQVTIDDQSAIAQVYPGFVQDFETLGASFIRYTE